MAEQQMETTRHAAGGVYGHCLTPMIAGLLFALPLAALIQRWSPAALES